MKQENSKAEELLEQGMSYFENDEYEEARPYLKQAAELGLLEAQCMYIIDLFSYFRRKRKRLFKRSQEIRKFNS